jgi:hypothetical protein
MKPGAVVLVLAALSACQLSPVDPSDTTLAHAGKGNLSTTEQAQIAQKTKANTIQPVGTPVPEGVGAEPTPPGTPSNGTPPALKAATTPPVDTAKRLEYVDVFVNLKDPAGQRQLVPYLLKLDEWTIVKVEHLTTTLKHYRFRRMTSPQDKPIPEIDPLMPRKPSPPPPTRPR